MAKVDFDRLLQECKEEIKDIVPFRETSPRVLLLNKRNKRTLGRCHRNLGSTYFTIYLNPKMYDMSEKLIKETLIHELIHTAERCFDHKYMFQAYANKVSRILGYNIETKCTSDEWQQAKTYKYKLTCVKCGEVYYRNRITKAYRNLYACGKCRGNLIIEELY